MAATISSSTGRKRVTAILVESDAIYRLGLYSFLQRKPYISQIIEFDFQHQVSGLANIPKTGVAIIGIDCSLKIDSGVFSFLAAHNIRCLVLCGSSKPGSLQSLLKYPIDGLLPKSADLLELNAALTKILNSERYFCPKLQSVVKQHPLSTLSHREHQVLDLISQGKTNPAIGKLLGISLKTVDSHRTNIMRKMDAHTVVELLRKIETQAPPSVEIDKH